MPTKRGEAGHSASVMRAKTGERANNASSSRTNPSEAPLRHSAVRAHIDAVEANLAKAVDNPNEDAMNASVDP